MVATQENALIRAEAGAAARPHLKFLILSFVFITALGQFGQVFGANKTDAGAIIMLGNMLAAFCWYICITAWLSQGYARVMLLIISGREPHKNDLFVGGKDFTRSVFAVLTVTIKTFLWFLLFVVPGIVAWFKYCLTYYVMLDRPDLTGAQCVSESCRLMRGNKMKMFKLLFWYYIVFFVIAVALDGLIYYGLILVLDKGIALSIASALSFSIASVVYNVKINPVIARFYRLVAE